MILSIPPVLRLNGRIQLPASKSYSIRAFIIAARGGVSQIEHASECEDAVIALKTARALGSTVSYRAGVCTVKAPESLVILSEAKDLKMHLDPSALKRGLIGKSPKVFSVGESGTTLRFLLPLLASHTQRAKVKGTGTLKARPNAHLCETLRRQGMDIRGWGKNESVPIVYNGGVLRGGRVLVDGSLSSQFVSALMIACPSLDNDSRIVLTGKEMVSQDYIQMTMEILSKAGIVIKRISPREYVIKGKQ